MIRLNTPLGELPGVGPARAKGLSNLGLATAEDLLFYYPRQYEDRRQTSAIAQAPADRPVCVEAMISETPRLARIRRGLELVKARACDDTGMLELTFFNQAYVKDVLRPGESYVFFGRVEGAGAVRQMSNPVFERADGARFTGRIMPVYALTAGISNNLVAGLVRRVLDSGVQDQAAEQLPAEIRRTYGLSPIRKALAGIHFPASQEELAEARKRMIFQELFTLSAGLSLLRARRTGAEGPRFLPQDAEEFLALLPFSPTGAQRRVMAELSADLTSGRPMNRLVQGDVGSGKTAVAAFGAWLAWKNGWQSALMAPTEILAEQHFRTLSGILSTAGMRVGLLTGAQKAAEKREILSALAAGEIDLLVGTHALITPRVVFHRLGLAAVDEQHRFGVNQRSALAAKGELSPHVLVLSATPIPRTLALIIYGDLDVSVLDELPPGRTPVSTCLVGEEKRPGMYGFVRRLVREGRQAYIVCPAVEENSGLSAGPGAAAPALKAVTAYAEHLRKEVFPDLRVGLVHGRLKVKEKERVMAAFAAGELDVLVSTTVIEVGVDVPNAALMIVENAERFGLSQLHQLRGRVGRGAWQSWCVLLSADRDPDTRARLRTLVSTDDGFRISEEDLRLRGPGDFFGARQHGLPRLKAADLASDLEVLRQAQQAAQHLVETDPDLSRPENRPLLEQVRRMFADNPDIFN